MSKLTGCSGRILKMTTVSKKSFLRTLEAIIAIGIMLAFIAAMSPRTSYSEKKQIQESLRILEHDDAFRNCALSGSGSNGGAASNVECAYDYINDFIPNNYNYNITISSDENELFAELPPDKQIYSDSVMIAGNSTYYNATIIRVYYWQR